MQYTNHYNLNLPEGSDIVNPLVQDNPNYTAIDGALYANKVRTVGNATEVKSGTVHAITRSDSDIDVIRFTATGNWDTGDTMTVDGTPVSVYLADGTAPLTGAYVINTEVIAAINGSRVTLYTGAGAVTSLDADHIVYDNAGSGMSATDVQGAIDEIDADLDEIKKSNAGTPISLDSYIGSGIAYTAPSDGYIRTSCGAATNEQSYILSNSIAFCASSGNGVFGGAREMFVRKGFTFTCGGSSTAHAMFIPLV